MAVETSSVTLDTLDHRVRQRVAMVKGLLESAMSHSNLSKLIGVDEISRMQKRQH